MKNIQGKRAKLPVLIIGKVTVKFDEAGRLQWVSDWAKVPDLLKLGHLQEVKQEFYRTY